MPKIVIGVMGPGAGATPADMERAFELGKLIAKRGWVLLSGGRNEGVMDAVNQGAKSADGLTVGIIPTGNDENTSEAVDISIVTNMASARNNINVLSSKVVIACGTGPGTASEVALAIKAKRQVVLLADSKLWHQFFTELGEQFVRRAQTAEEAITICEELVLLN